MTPSTDDPYRAASRYYDIVIEPLNRKLKAMALSFAPPEPGQSVLDVGCGTGTMLELYHRAGCELWGIDASAAMLAVARRRLDGRAELLHGDATAMPYADEQFDWVTATMMLHELPPTVRRGVLEEALRVLKPDGRLLIVDYHTGPRGLLRGRPVKLLITVIERLAGGAHWAGFQHHVAHGAIRGLTTGLGLRVERERIVAHGNLAITVLARRAPDGLPKVPPESF